MPPANIYFGHIRKLQRMLDDAVDVESVIAAINRVRLVQVIWADIADHLKSTAESSGDPTLEDEILQDVMQLGDRLDAALRELGNLPVQRPPRPAAGSDEAARTDDTPQDETPSGDIQENSRDESGEAGD